MTQRNSVTVIILSLVTFGIYALIWLVKTKDEMNARGATIPTAWLILLPIVGPLIFFWKWSEGFEKVTNKAQPAAIMFLLFLVFAPVAWYLAQEQFNKIQ